MNCRMGMENYCEKPAATPAAAGWAVTTAEWLPTCSFRRRASWFRWGRSIRVKPLRSRDAALTSYHAIKRSRHLLGPGSTAVVIGAGGLGQMAIQILRALSAATTIVAVDTAADKLEIAKRMGADEGLLSGDEAVKRVKDVTQGQGAELVLDLVGVNPTLQMAAQMARVARPPDDRRSRWRSFARQFPQPAARVFRRITLLGLYPRAHGSGQSRPGWKNQDAGRTLSAGARAPRRIASSTTARSRDAPSLRRTGDCNLATDKVRRNNPRLCK